MPTVLRIDGLRFVIFLDDHQPEHVHVIGSDSEAVIWLHCPEGPPELRKSYRFKAAKLRRIMAIVEDNVMPLCAEWRRIHGS